MLLNQIMSLIFNPFFLLRYQDNLLNKRAIKLVLDRISKNKNIGKSSSVNNCSHLLLIIQLVRGLTQYLFKFC